MPPLLLQKKLPQPPDPGGRIEHLLGFIIAAGAALYDGWTIQELCWSFWLCGLGVCLTTTILAPLRLLLNLNNLVPASSAIHTWLEKQNRNLSSSLITSFLVTGFFVLSYLAFRVYCFLFAFYGLFLSAFAAMEPLEYFGPNGFINSDGITPVLHLLSQYWPMVVGTLIAEIRFLLDTPPVRLLGKPFDRELVKVHIAVVLMPFISLFAWMILGENYQIIAVVLILAVFYYVPSPADASPTTH
jgi:hypothetical protein